MIADIKSLIAKDLKGLPGWGAKVRCMLPGYFVFRFGKSSRAQSDVGMAANLVEPVYVQVGAGWGAGRRGWQEGWKGVGAGRDWQQGRLRGG